MQLMSRKTDPAKIYIATTSFAADGVEELAIVKGTRLRGDHAAVRKYPQLFVDDGTPEKEWPPEFAGMIEAGEIADAAERAAEAKRHPTTTIPRDDELEVRVGFRTGVNGRSYGVGDRVSRKDPAIARVLKEHPECFQVPARPLPVS